MSAPNTPSDPQELPAAPQDGEGTVPADAATEACGQPAKRPYTLSPAALAQRQAAAAAGGAAPKGYTLTPAALEQRRAAAQLSTGPVTPEGKAAASRNAWKHGRYSAIHHQAFAGEIASMAKLFGTPCRTTCPVHPDNPERSEAPCSLVTNGLTRAGSSCLDKSVYVQRFDAIMTALQDGTSEPLHGVLANEVAMALQLLHQLRQSVFEEGLTFTIPATSRDGKVITRADGSEVIGKIVANPALGHIIMLLDKLGINFPELLATPKAERASKRDDDTGGALQALLGHAAARLQPPPADAP